jgi:hypothetical protein
VIKDVDPKSKKKGKSDLDQEGPITWPRVRANKSLNLAKLQLV